MPLYFAYGSNMSPRQMLARCPGARSAGRATLAGWRFHITTRGTANIVRASGAIVHGVLWRVTPRHLRDLDRWEGVGLRVYRRRWVQLAAEGATARTAVVYIADRIWPGQARPTYVLTAVLPGARAFALPTAYQNEIRGWLPRRRRGAPHSHSLVAR